MTIDLAPEEWCALISKYGGGLDVCCSTVSDLRDLIIAVAREGGRVTGYDIKQLLRVYAEFAAQHSPADYPILLKFMSQVKALAGELDMDDVPDTSAICTVHDHEHLLTKGDFYKESALLNVIAIAIERIRALESVREDLRSRLRLEAALTERMRFDIHEAVANGWLPSGQQAMWDWIRYGLEQINLLRNHEWFISVVVGRLGAGSVVRYNGIPMVVDVPSHSEHGTVVLNDGHQTHTVAAESVVEVIADAYRLGVDWMRLYYFIKDRTS